MRKLKEKTLGGFRRRGVDGTTLNESSRNVLGWRDWIS